MKRVDPAVRQQHLLARSAALRLSLADQVQVLKTPLALADQARAGLQWLYRHPLWSLGTGVLMAVVLPKVLPKRALLWGGRAWGAWATFRRMRKQLATPPRKRR